MGLKKPTPAGLDTSDATMINTDLISGKTGYAKGQKITGSLPITPSITTMATVDCDSYHVNLYGKNPNNCNLIQNADLTLKTPITNFGEALPSEVMSGKTFTSVSGIKQTGTHICTDLATATADATATTDDILLNKIAYAKGLKLIGTHICQTLTAMTADATAAEADILSGKTAYVNGAKITGTNVRVNRQWGTLTGNIPNVTGLSFDPTLSIIFPKLAITADGGTNHSCLLACIDGNTFSLQYNFISQIISRQNTASFSHSQGSFKFYGYTPDLADIEYYYICGN